MAKRKTQDPDTEAALAVVEMEKSQGELKEAEQKTREQAIAQCHEVIGRIQGLKMMSKFADVSNLMWLRDVKAQKIYRDLPEIGTWDKFCEYIGLSRQKVDEDLTNLRVFGEEFLTTVGSFRVGYRELRKLRQLTHDGDVTIDAEFVTIGEEQIPLSSESAEDLQAAIESLLEGKNKQIEDQTASIVAKDKLLKDKEVVMNRQEKEIAKLKGKAEKVGYTEAEEKLMQDMDNAREIFLGLMNRFDPDRRPLPEDASPKMRARLMHTLEYFRREVLATFDTAADLYGIPEIDDDWEPPHLRAAGGSED